MGAPNRIVLALAAVVVAGSSLTTGAYTLPHGEGDWALAALQDEPSQTAVYLSVRAWGTTYYGGIPPHEQGGLGDGVVCLEVFRSTDNGDVHTHGCADGVAFEFDRLRSVTVEDTLDLEVRIDDAEPGLEPVTLTVTLTATGVPYPGARAQTNPSPGAEAEYSIIRNVTVSGTIESPALGTIDLADASGALGTDNCYALMTRDDNVEACRF